MAHVSDVSAMTCDAHCCEITCCLSRPSILDANFDAAAFICSLSGSPGLSVCSGFGVALEYGEVRAFSCNGHDSLCDRGEHGEIRAVACNAYDSLLARGAVVA